MKYCCETFGKKFEEKRIISHHGNMVFIYYDNSDTPYLYYEYIYLKYCPFCGKELIN